MPRYLANSRMYPETKTSSRTLEAHLEAIGVLKRHYGFVPPGWVATVAEERLKGFLGKGASKEGFVYKSLRLAVAGWLLLRHNGLNPWMRGFLSSELPSQIKRAYIS